jgi:hypothetical protein
VLAFAINESAADDILEQCSPWYGSCNRGRLEIRIWDRRSGCVERPEQFSNKQSIDRKEVSMFKRSLGSALIFTFLGCVLCSCSNDVVHSSSSYKERAAIVDVDPHEQAGGTLQENSDFPCVVESYGAGLNSPRSIVSVYFISRGGQIASSISRCSLAEISPLLSSRQISEILDRTIVEIAERSRIVEFIGTLEQDVLIADSSSITMIGLMTFDECVWECCGGRECSWGRIKYCFDLCSRDHGPKPNEPYNSN